MHPTDVRILYYIPIIFLLFMWFMVSQDWRYGSGVLIIALYFWTAMHMILKQELEK